MASSSASSNSECVKMRRSPSCWTESAKVGELQSWVAAVFSSTCVFLYTHLDSSQTWAAVRSHGEGRLWSCAATCPRGALSRTQSRLLTALLPSPHETISGPLLTVFKPGIPTQFADFCEFKGFFFPDLPKSQCLHFDCGVQVQLGFAAEFSNVMVIYTRILVKPEEIVSCSAQLTDFAEVCSLLS